MSSWSSARVRPPYHTWVQSGVRSAVCTKRDRVPPRIGRGPCDCGSSEYAELRHSCDWNVSTLQGRAAAVPTPARDSTCTAARPHPSHLDECTFPATVVQTGRTGCPTRGTSALGPFQSPVARGTRITQAARRGTQKNVTQCRTATAPLSSLAPVGMGSGAPNKNRDCSADGGGA